MTGREATDGRIRYQITAAAPCIAARHHDMRERGVNWFGARRGQRSAAVLRQ